MVRGEVMPVAIAGGGWRSQTFRLNPGRPGLAQVRARSGPLRYSHSSRSNYFSILTYLGKNRDEKITTQNNMKHLSQCFFGIAPDGFWLYLFIIIHKIISLLATFSVSWK